MSKSLSSRSSTSTSSSAGASSAFSRLFVIKANAAATHANTKKSWVGIPGISPNTKITKLVGIQAADKLSCEDMCSDIFSAEDTRVTIIAVAIDKSSEGICATKPSPIANRT